MAIKVNGVIFYSVTEVAQIINATTVTVRNYINDNLLKADKVFGRWLISEGNLKEFLNNMDYNNKVVNF